MGVDLGSNMSKTAAFAAFEALVRSRFACKKLKADPIPASIQTSLLELTMRAPTSVNTQPYKVIMVASESRRSVLSEAMLGPNAQRVSQAPLTAVFCADTEYSREIPRLQQLYRDTSNPRLSMWRSLYLQWLNYFPWDFRSHFKH